VESSVAELLIVGPPGELVITFGTQDFYPERFGWFYRMSVEAFEMWLAGSSPLVTITAEQLQYMPGGFEDEVRAAVDMKGPFGIL
jgi:hypothetical protein